MHAFEQAIKTVRGNWVAAVSTVTTMTLALSILMSVSLLSLNLNNVLGDLRGDLRVTVFLTPDADATSLINTLRARPDVANLTFTGRDTNLNELVADLPALRQAATLVDNPLPDTLTLQVTDPALTAAVARDVRALPGVSAVEDASEAVGTFVAISDAVRVLGTVVTLVLLTVTLFAVVNAIRAAIHARRNEIEVMRLVGATNAFVRAPFLVEGFLLALASAALTMLLTLPSYRYLVARLAPELPFIPFARDGAAIAQVAMMVTALALLLGLVGSAIAISQRLQESD
jgi:cell division protein FtsX